MNGSSAGARTAVGTTGAIALVAFAVHLWVALTAGGPVAVPDVAAYLSIAQWIGAGGLAPQDLAYQPGFGLLVAPLVALASAAGALPASGFAPQGQLVHQLGLILNAVAAAGAVALAGRLGWLLRCQWKVAALAAVLAAVHPSLSSASRIAWPEALLTLTILGLATLVVRAVNPEEEPKPVGGGRLAWRAWGGAGLLAALAVALHARAAVLVLALVAAALVCRARRRSWAALTGGVALGGGVSLVLLAVTETWPSARLNEAMQLDRGFEPFVTGAGQLLALSGGTVGLGVLGLAVGIAGAMGTQRVTCDAQEQAEPLRAVAVFVAVGACGALLLGAWSLTGSDRTDAALYGRYLDPWAVPLAIVALGWFAAWRRESVRRVALAVAVFVAVCCGIVLVAASGYSAAPRRIMTLSFSPAWKWLGANLTVVALAALAVSFVGIALASVGAWTPKGGATGCRWRGAAAALAILLGATATFLNNDHLTGVGDVARGQVTASRSVADQFASKSGAACLAHDAAKVPSYARWLYRLELPRMAHESVDLDIGGVPCSELVIADDGLDQRCVNARLLEDEPAGSWALWHLPKRRCAAPSGDT